MGHRQQQEGDRHRQQEGDQQEAALHHYHPLLALPLISASFLRQFGTANPLDLLEDPLIFQTQGEAHSELEDH